MLHMAEGQAFEKISDTDFKEIVHHTASSILNIENQIVLEVVVVAV